MKFLKTHYASLIILLIFAAGIYVRAAWYGDLRLSIANAETDSYVSASRASIFSWKIFAGQRLFTTNLIYKLANDSANCPITSFGKPGLGEEDVREIQPCFDGIALLQNFLSIFGWCFLGWMLARWLKNPFVKIFGATSIMVFGFTPQIAEWDSVLSPESLSLSMFAILLGLALEVVFRAVSLDEPFKSASDKILLAVLSVWYLLWVFVRDVHLYAIPITLILLIPLFFLTKFKTARRPLYYASAALFVFFIVGYLSARDSLRATRFPLMNSLDEYILPYPSRVEFFKRYGMPEKEAPDYKDAPIYQAWADENAPKAYAMFLLTHPGFVVTTLWYNLDMLSGEYTQPYFFTHEIQNRESLLMVGEMVNPQTGAVYLLTFIMVLVYFVQAIQNRAPRLSAWAWLAVCVYGIAAGTLFISYFGDTAGIRRHIMPSVEMFRLYLWVFLPPFLDLSMGRESRL
ncbi:MAG: hypothetical protein DYG86_09580 [Chloroflexi bacterium CFX2]|nr:hypothetical protein [Chloroflexi bacterium CFX2]